MNAPEAHHYDTSIKYQNSFIASMPKLTISLRYSTASISIIWRSDINFDHKFDNLMSSYHRWGRAFLTVASIIVLDKSQILILELKACRLHVIDGSLSRRLVLPPQCHI